MSLASDAEEAFAVHRQADGGAGFTTLTPPYEPRLLVICQGLQFDNGEYRRQADRADAEGNPVRASQWRAEVIPQGFQQAYPDLQILNDTDALYQSHAQQVIFFLRVITTKPALKEALATPGAHVIYAGHARHGLGPCLGPDSGPGDHWGDGAVPPGTGLFRMGFPFVAMPVPELLEHRYHVRAHSGSSPRPARSDCHPDVRNRWNDLRARPLSEIVPDAADRAVVAGLLGEPADTGSTFWSYRAREHGVMAAFLVLEAGWEGTSTAPFDLGAAELRCRAFIHLGCSSFVHAYRIVRFAKGWRRAGNDRYAYWTTAPAPCTPLAECWVNAILGYDQPNAWQSWHPSLRYAVREANRAARDADWPCRVI